MSEEVGVSCRPTHVTSTERSTRCISTNSTLWLLTQEKRENRLSAASDMLESAEADDNFLKDIITGGVTCVYGYDPETMQ